MKLRSPAWLTAVAALALGVGLVIAAAPRSAAQPGSKDDRGFLGVSLQDLDDDLRDSYDYDGAGALVTDVVPGSPADELGVEEGDILIRLDDRSVSGSDQATEYVRERSPGTMVAVWVWRDGEEKNLGRAELADVDDRRWRNSERATPRPPREPRAMRARPSPSPAPRPTPAPRVEGLDLEDLPKSFSWLGRGRLGVETRDLDKDLGSYFQRPEGGGVLVLGVVDDTPAEKAGLKPGDVILSVGGKDVSDTDGLREALADRDAGAVDLRVLRNGTARTMSVTLEQAPSHDFMRLRDGHGFMSWNWDDDDKSWKMSDRMKRRMSGLGPRLRVLRDLGDLDELRDLSPEEKKELEKDMEELRKDLRELRKEMRDLHDRRR